MDAGLPLERVGAFLSTPNANLGSGYFWELDLDKIFYYVKPTERIEKILGRCSGYD